MMTDEQKQKAVEEMAKIIIKQIPYEEKKLESDCEYAIDLSLGIATALVAAHYRPEAEVRAEAVKEFAEKLKAIIDLDRNKEEFLNRPKTAKATDYWLKEWYDKCNMLNDLAEANKIDY